VHDSAVRERPHIGVTAHTAAESDVGLQSCKAASMPTRRRGLLVAAGLLALPLAAAVAMLSGVRVLQGAVVVLIGVSGLVAAALGKPSSPGFGLTEILLHRLPDPLWRAVLGVLGLGIAAFGLVVLTQ
jgi:hypothetical protein